MKPEKILDHCLRELEGVVLVESWGERAIFYNPDGKLKRGVYVVTIKDKDGENDKSSRLDRPGAYRVNMGVRKTTFESMFGPLPKRPPKGGVVDMDYDFSASGQLLPHPVYAWMGWVCLLNPGEAAFEVLKPLIREAYACAKEKYQKRAKQRGKNG